uniref:DegT/DnrJ/EryC1/StrS aminotransferase family protein n=1 Tax=viral metagenome TaxID=1070528 RepID=A0A6C0HD59_9ZZZZ
MNVNWIFTKHINHETVKNLLELSSKNNQFTNGGPVVQLLEQNIRKILSINDDKDVIAVTNGSVAIWVAVNSIEFYNNKKLRWATQSFTFPPSAQGMLQDILIEDIDLDGGLELTDDLKDKVDGIIVTNVFGNTVNIDKYVNWCNTHNKYLIFDNAATSYSFYKGQNSLNYGNASTLSFHHTKPLGFGEGGAVIIDKQFSKYLRQLINFGIDNNAINPIWHPLGSNYKMSDISAAYIIQHLNNFDEIYTKTIKVINYFKSKLSNKISFYPNFSDDNPLLSCLCCILPSKDLIIEKSLKEHNVFCRKYYKPLLFTPNSTYIYNNILCIPCHCDMSTQDIDIIVNIILSNI